jgi:hypothetical protein
MNEFEHQPIPNIETSAEQEQSKEIFEDTELDSKVTILKNPLVKPSEGTHLRVEPREETLPYFDPDAKISDSLKPFLAAIAVARSVFGNPENPNEYYYWSQWVNVHLLPRFGGQRHLQIEVIGRSARGNTWAKPIEYPGGENYEPFKVTKEELIMHEREIPKNLSRVKDEAHDTTLFDQESAEDKIEADKLTVFQFQNFEIKAPKNNPHVWEGGLHLWVHAYMDENAEGVQSNVKIGIEQFIIASAVAKSIYEEMGVPIEIHFSGNWGLIPKDEKIKTNQKENLSAHANLYGAPPSHEGVELPPRPKYERSAIPEETRQRAQKALEKHFKEYASPFLGKKLSELIK